MSAIGAERQEATSYFRRFQFASFHGILSAKAFDQAARHGRCQAKRSSCVLIPRVVAWLMMYANLQGTSMADALTQAWGLVQCLMPAPGAQAVTEEAFVQARQKLKLRFWQHLFAGLVARYQRHFDSDLRIKGRYLVKAIDGTVLTLGPFKRLTGYFGRLGNHKGKAKRPTARLVSVVTVLSSIRHAFVLVPLKISETLCLMHLIPSLLPFDILLEDAGFFCYAAMVRIRQRRAHYLLRITPRAASFAVKLRVLGPDDWLVEFRPGRTVRKRWPELPTAIRCRLIRYRMPGFRDSFLITSLANPAVFSREELVALYHKRWRIETVHRDWKHVLAAGNIRSTTPAGVCKEVFAQLTLWNLTRWVMTEAAQKSGRDAMELSFNNALTRIKSLMPAMAVAQPQALECLYRQLLRDIAAAVIRQRPGRSYPRPGDGKIKDKGKGRKQLPARLSTA